MSRTELVEALFEARDVSAEEFPTSGTRVEKLRFLLKYAILAPSSHNTQPWLFKVREDYVWEDYVGEDYVGEDYVGEDYVELYADRSRALPVADPEDRELIISCGAALFHLCIALRHFGYEDEVEIFPDPHEPDLLASVRMGSPWAASEMEHELFYAMVKRRTNRMPFFNRKVPEGLLEKLEEAARQQGAWLQVLREEGDKNALATLISQGDRIQWADKRFRRELAAWVHPNRSLSSDGIPGYAMGLGDLMSITEPVVIRTFDLGNGWAARDLELATGSPVLAVLGTQGDTPRDWLRAGEALARMLLLATAHGVSASFLNQPIEVAEMRLLVLDITNRTGFPQLVLRMGYGPEVGLTPRRPVSAFTL